MLWPVLQTYKDRKWRC